MKAAALEFRPYRRRFDPPLETAHGPWTDREGFLLRIETADGRTGFGEAAPLPAFGTETVAAAATCLQDWRENPSAADPGGAPPCCAFALSSALRMARGRLQLTHTHRVAALLPAGTAAVARMRELAPAGFRTFKWKIAVHPGATERALFPALADALPAGGRLRLDPNGGLDGPELESWLDLLQNAGGAVEYLEQPLPPGSEDRLRTVASQSPVAIALDESLHQTDGLRWLEPGAWPGPAVLKPALLGDVDRLGALIRERQDPTILSSAFETDVGFASILSLAEESGLADACHGFHTSVHFADGMNRLPPGPLLAAAALSETDLAERWNNLRPSN